MLALPIAFRSAIGVFAPVFARPVWPQVKVLRTGAVLAPGQRTVAAMLRMMGRRVAPDFPTYHRGLHRAVWSPLTASRLLLRLLVAVCMPRGVVVLGLEDTIARRRGDRITAKASTAIPCGPVNLGYQRGKTVLSFLDSAFHRRLIRLNCIAPPEMGVDPLIRERIQRLEFHCGTVRREPTLFYCRGKHRIDYSCQ